MSKSGNLNLLDNNALVDDVLVLDDEVDQDSRSQKLNLLALFERHQAYN